jgi:hypothetical protein
MNNKNILLATVPVIILLVAGIIVENGRERLLQDITITYMYQGFSGAVTEDMPLTISMEVSSMQLDHLRYLSGADMLSPGDEDRTIWYSGAGYANKAPTDRLPPKEEVLYFNISFDGVTETVTLHAAES